MIKNIIIYNDAHIGDVFFSISIVKLFRKYNKDMNIIFTSRNALGFLHSVDNILFMNYFENDIFYKNKFKPYFIYNDETIAINSWIAGIRSEKLVDYDDLECVSIIIYDYIRKHVDIINNKFNTNIHLPQVSKSEILTTIPTVNIDGFIEWRKTKECDMIFYYNYSPCSGQCIGNINHDSNIITFSNIYKDKIIIVPKLTNILKEYINKNNITNIISCEQFGYVETPTCESVFFAYYVSQLCKYSIVFDVGACFTYANDKLLNSNCLVIHCGVNMRYFIKLYNNFDMNIDDYFKKVIYINSENEDTFMQGIKMIIQ